MIQLRKCNTVVVLVTLILVIISCDKSEQINSKLDGKWVRSYEVVYSENKVYYKTEVVDFETDKSGVIENYKFNKIDTSYGFNYTAEKGILSLEWEGFSKEYNYEIQNDSLYMTSIELPHMSFRDFRVYTRPVEKDFDTDTIELNFNSHYCSNRGDYCLVFDTIYEDSRCPIDVNCVWEGNAEIGFVLFTSEATQQFTLNTNSQYTNDTTISNYSFKLLDLLPNRVSTDTISQLDYKVILVLD